MSKKQKLTPWFPASVKPARRGSYEVGYMSFDGITPYPYPYHWFDGEEWGDDAFSKPTKQKDSGRMSIQRSYMNAYWRGLTKEPK